MMFRSTLAILLLLTANAAISAAGNPAPYVSLPEYAKSTLPNGATVLLAEKADVPLVGMQVIIRGGAIADPDGLEGTADLLAGLLEKGAGFRDAAAFAEAADAVGGTLSAAAGLEAITIGAEFLSRDADLMVELVADMLVRPRLDETEFVKLRDRAVELIKSAKDSSPQSLISAYGAAWLFGDHPYGKPLTGSEASLKKVEADDIRAFYEQEIGADRLIIAVSGDFDADEMQTRLGDAFGKWRKAKNPVGEIEDYPRQKGRRVLLIDKPGATQTYFWIGNTGVAISYANRAELDLANTVYGGRFTSMLNTELRVNTGLTYGASSSLQRPSKRGSQAIVSYTKTESTLEAIDRALSVSGRFRDAGLDDQALQSAKNYVLGQFPTRLETATQLAGQLAQLEFYGLDDSYVDAYGGDLQIADRKGIDAVIAEVYPPLDDLVFVLIGDADLIREQVSKYGKVTEMSITDEAFRP